MGAQPVPNAPLVMPVSSHSSTGQDGATTSEQYAPREVSPRAAVTRVPLWRFCRRAGGASAWTIVSYTLVDTADAAWVRQWRWRLADGYAVRHERGRVYLHRELLGLPRVWVPGDSEGMHRNRDRLDNHRANLYVVSHAQRAQNRPPVARSQSRLRGVAPAPGGRRWLARAHAYVSGRSQLVRLGHYATAYDAARVAAQWRQAHMPYSVEEPTLVASPLRAAARGGAR